MRKSMTSMEEREKPGAGLEFSNEEISASIG